MRHPPLIRVNKRLAGAVLALALAAAACGTAPGSDSNDVVTTDLSEVLPDGLFEALDRIANPPEEPAPDDSVAEELALEEPISDEPTPDEPVETLVPAQADTETELPEEELLKLRDETFVEFSRCIREEGFPDFPDIDSSQIVDQATFLSAMQEAGVSFTQAGLVPALQTCASVFSELIALAPQQDTNVQQVEREENSLAFAQCMRDQGLDEFPDPDFNQFPGSGFDNSGNNAGNITSEIRAALDVCLPVLGGAQPNQAAAPSPASEPSTTAQVTARSTQSTTTQTPSTSTPASPAQSTGSQSPRADSWQQHPGSGPHGQSQCAARYRGFEHRRCCSARLDRHRRVPGHPGVRRS